MMGNNVPAGRTLPANTVSWTSLFNLIYLFTVWVTAADMQGEVAEGGLGGPPPLLAVEGRIHDW